MQEHALTHREQTLSEFLSPVLLGSSSQLLMEIKNNESFYDICQYFESIGECGNISADPDYVHMRMNEAEDRDIEEMEAAVEKLG